MAFDISKHTDITRAVVSTIETFDNIESIAKLTDALQNINNKPLAPTLQVIKQNLEQIHSFSTQDVSGIVKKIDAAMEKLSAAKSAKRKSYQGSDPTQKIYYESLVAAKADEYKQGAKEDVKVLAAEISQLEDMRKNILQNWLARVQENIGEIGNQCMELTSNVSDEEIQEFVEFKKKYKPGAPIPEDYSGIVAELKKSAGDSNWYMLPEQQVKEIAEKEIENRWIYIGKDKGVPLQKMIEDMLKMQDYFLIQATKNALEGGELVNYLKNKKIQVEKLEKEFMEVSEEISPEAVLAQTEKELEKLKNGSDNIGEIGDLLKNTIKNKVNEHIEKLKNEEIRSIQEDSKKEVNKEVQNFVEFKKNYKPGAPIPDKYAKIVNELDNFAAPGFWYEFPDVAKVINKNKKITGIFEENLSNANETKKITEKYENVKDMINVNFIKNKYSRAAHHDALFNYLYNINNSEKSVKLGEFYLMMIGNLLESAGHIATFLDKNKLAEKHIQMYKRCLQFITPSKK